MTTTGTDAAPIRLKPVDRAEFQALAAIFRKARAGQEPGSEPLATTRLPTVREDGTSGGLPWTDYADPIHHFWRLVHHLQLCADPFDWPAWLASIRASGADPFDPELVANLSSGDLRRYLTVLERAERFADGTWRVELEAGVFEAVLNRIRVLADDQQDRRR